MKRKPSLSYLITVSQAHWLPVQMCVMALRRKTENEIVVVGNLEDDQVGTLKALGVRYIDEDDIDYDDRLPNVSWESKYRKFGWYKQMFIRHSIDKYIDTDQVVILDSEVFVFDNWDERRLYEKDGITPRSFYWVPAKRKPDWDYRMYRGAAYLLSFLPECEDIMEYANSDNYQRHISGVVLFSTENVAELWRRLKADTDFEKNLDDLFNDQPDLSFSDHDIYGLAVEYGLFDKAKPTKMHNNLLGWYEVHDDSGFASFKRNAMWSMTQNYTDYPTINEYYSHMNKLARDLDAKLPQPKKGNIPDFDLINQDAAEADGIEYFEKYEKQLDHSHRMRYQTMYGALKQLVKAMPDGSHTIVEIGTMRDTNKGGGHSTFKFGEFCSRYGSRLYTVDILKEALDYSREASADWQPWIEYVQSDSTKFLSGFEGEIDLLYLDGFDSTPGKEKEASKKQLDEIKAALPHLAPGCVVLLDDADLPEGGKAALSSQFLLDSGFKLVIDGYQQLYFRGGKIPVGSVPARQVAKKVIPLPVRKVIRKVIK